MTFFSYKNLAISNIMFSNKIAHNLTCYSNDYKTANLIDYFIINTRVAGKINITFYGV